MKKYINFITLMMSIFAYSQVNVDITNLTNNNVFVTSCGTINFGAESNINVTAYITLTKPHAQVVGTSELFVYTIGTSGQRISRIPTPTFILENQWTQGSQSDSYLASTSFSLPAGDFSVSGGTLFSVFKSSGGIEYQTNCSYSITKNPTPTFNLSPTTLSIPCNDVSARTFTVANVYNSAGTLTYNWSVGGNWLRNGSVALPNFTTTTNSITLVPASATTIPGNVSVVPVFNGVNQPSKTCTVSRSAIASSGSISGNASICTTRTYTFAGLLAGQSVNWSLSNATAGTLSTTTGSSTIFTKTGGGAVNLSATVSNACGQSYTKTVSLFAGSPPAFSLVRASNETCDGIKYHYVPFEIPNRNPLITYTFNIAPIPGVTVTQSTQTYNGNIQNVLRFPKTYVGPVDFTVSTTNSCGNFTFLAEEEINSCSGLGLRLSNTVKQFAVFPNPAKDIVTIELRNQENQIEKNIPISAELFDMIGQSKSKIQISDNKANFSVRELKKGIYILKIYINDQIEIHQIAVE